MPQIFSPIQNHILSRLKNAKSLRYSELMASSQRSIGKIPNDLFNYHLQFLVKKGFVNKSGSLYSLAELGIKYVADPYLPVSQDKISSLFKVNVITIVSRLVTAEASNKLSAKVPGKISLGKVSSKLSSKKRSLSIQILNQVRASHPSFGKVGVMGGVVRKGESIEAAAKRKLEAETGLVADFKVIGMTRRMMYIKDLLFSDVFFPITYADECFGEIISDTEFGHNMWVDIDQAIKNESADFDSIKGIGHALKALKDGTIHKLPFFYMEDVQRG